MIRLFLYVRIIFLFLTFLFFMPIDAFCNNNYNIYLYNDFYFSAENGHINKPIIKSHQPYYKIISAILNNNNMIPINITCKQEGYVFDNCEDGIILSLYDASKICPEIAAFYSPFLFQDFNEISYIKEKFIKYIYETFKNKGFIMIGWTDDDFEYLFIRKNVIKISYNHNQINISSIHNKKFSSYHDNYNSSISNIFQCNFFQSNMLEFNSKFRTQDIDITCLTSKEIATLQLIRYLGNFIEQPVKYYSNLILLNMKSPNIKKLVYTKIKNPAVDPNVDDIFIKRNMKYLKALADYGVLKIIFDNYSTNYVSQQYKDRFLKNPDSLRLFNRIQYELSVYRKSGAPGGK